jgi:predicted 2-oxoglutarate/Fe(II)-dependent dioxygenase YbiX
MSSALDVECYGVRVRVVDDAGAGVCPRLSELLPQGAGASLHGAADACYVVRHAEAVDAGPPAYQVVRDGQVRFRARTADETARWLCGNIDSTVAQTSRAWLFVHAGVVGWRGRAIVVPGRSMTGKSTLVSALVRRGATYYSDEFAVLDGDGQVHPYARMPMLRGMPGVDGEAPARACLGSAGRGPLPVSLIVSMPYRDGAAWRPTVVRGARAILPLIDNTVLARTAPERTLRISAALAPTVVTLEGARPDAEIAAGRILEFLDSVLDGGSIAGASRDLAQARLERARALQGAATLSRAAFVRIDRVLEPDEHTRLLEYARSHEADFAASGVIAADGASHVDPAVRHSGTFFHADEPAKLLESRLRRLLPHVRRELGASWFPLGRTEVQLAVHQDGGFFAVHTDDGREAVAGRRITCVYYFHGRPKRFSGGELLIYDTETRAGRPVRAGSHVGVEPADNTAVFFPSSLLHEVRPVHRQSEAFADSRFSVNLWFWVGPSPLPAPAGAARRSAG